MATGIYGKKPKITDIYVDTPGAGQGRGTACCVVYLPQDQSEIRYIGPRLSRYAGSATQDQ